MRRLAAVVAGSDASIVVCSSWREKEMTMKMLNQQLERAGLARAFDATPVAGFLSRTDEILDWLSRHPAVQHFVVLDDGDLSCPSEAFNRHLVRPKAEVGLQDADVGTALQILEQPIQREALPEARRPAAGFWS
eukprot:2091642-Prymnesium_polylepis.1